MKCVVCCIMPLLAVASQVEAGVVSFDPPVQFVDFGTGNPSEVTFTLTITDFGVAAGYNAVDILIGSDDLVILDWQPKWTWNLCDFATCDGQADGSIYASAWDWGYFGTQSPTPANQLLGTLTISTAGLEPGEYYVGIDADRDGGQSLLTAGTSSEPLYGAGKVRVIPEPATIILLGFGGYLSFARRRSCR
jgi:hypothetical protein